jgi:hypothetical protein
MIQNSGKSSFQVLASDNTLSSFEISDSGDIHHSSQNF